MAEYSAEDLFEIFANLQSANWRAIVVGGQAVNLWCSRYHSVIPELPRYQPIVSRDLDFYGGLSEAKLAMKALGATGRLNSGTDPSPNAGVIQVQMPEGNTLVIDILTSVYGVSSTELLRSAIAWSFETPKFSLTLRVIHPLLLLESKLACFRSLPQSNRQDEKHAILSSLVVKAWLIEQLETPRSVFKAVERLVGTMQTQDGLFGFAKGIDLWACIPVEEMRQNNAYSVFFEQRLHQLIGMVNTSRASDSESRS